ncbi:MAG: hypothetical protein BroJett024_03600 [Alphaproteobacteria bacterium]|nr:MAG: hypothetical protein BroJett024_03600 [Alphaproteobacteria bacterium]
MANTPKKAKDATEEAMSAIQEALKFRESELKAGPARPAAPMRRKTHEPAAKSDPAKSDAGKSDPTKSDVVLPTTRTPPLAAGDDDLFSDFGISSELRRPANDDRSSIGQLLQSMQPRTARTGYIAAAAASLVWIALVGIFAAGLLPDLRSGANAGLALLTLAAVFLLPTAFFFVLAHMVNRSREMRAIAQTMAQVAIRLGEPESAAQDSIVTVGQAIRREVAAMGDGVERALARAAELETLVHNEVSALERAYNDNEVRIRTLLDELNRQHDNLVTSAEQVRDSIKSVHLDLSSDITGISDVVAAQVNRVAADVTTTLAEKGQHITQALSETGDQMIAALGERGGDLLQRLENTSYQTQTAIAHASEQLSASLNFKTDHIPQEFETLAENLTQMMHLRLAGLTNDFAQRSNEIVDQMHERAGMVTNSYLETSSRLAETIALRGEEINNSIKATGDSLVLEMNLRGSEAASRLEKAAATITDALAERTNSAVEGFNRNAEMLANSVGARSETMRDMLAARLDAFEEIFTRGGTELAEKIGQDSGMLGNLITRNLTEFDRTVKVYGGELIERLGERTDKVAEAMRSHVDNFDGRVTAKVDEIAGNLDQRLDKFREALDSRAQTLTEAMSGRVLDIARTLAEGGREVVGALDRRIEEIGGVITTRGNQVADTLDSKVTDIDRTLGARALEVAGTLDDRIARFEQLLVGRAEKVTQEIETRGRAAAAALDHSNEQIRSSTENLERTLTNVSAGVTDALKQNAGEVERTLLGVGAEVVRTFVGKADEIATQVSGRAAEMTRVLDASSSTLLTSLTSKSQQFTAEVDRATRDAVSAIEAKGFDFTRSMLDNAGELARLINEASESASGRVDATLRSLHATAQDAVERTQTVTTAAVSEMVEAHNRLRDDTGGLFERLREANILLQEVLSGSQENMHRLETALASRVSEFATVMNDAAGRTGDITERVADQIQTFQSITSKVSEDLGHLAGQFDMHGRVLVEAVQLVDISNRKADESVNERRANLDSLIATLDIKSEELDQRLKRFANLLDESLESAATRAREIGRIVADTSAQGTQTITEAFELVRNSAEQERKRTKDTMQNIYEQAMGDTHMIFRQSTERFADVLQGIKQMAAEMQNELDATRSELRRGILEMPAETAESTAQMRRVIVDQIEALAELNRIVARHGGRIDNAEPRRVQEPTLTVIGGGRAASRPVMPRSEPSELPPPPRARRGGETPPPPPAPAAGPAKSGSNWLSDLLHRASRDENADAARSESGRGEERPARHMIESLDALSVDIARMIDHDAAAELWDRYNRGERNIFTRRLYTLQGQQAFDEIRKRYRSDREFKQTVDRYIAEFERLLEDVSRDDRGQVVVRTYLTSETGKVYTMLAHAAGRFE